VTPSLPWRPPQLTTGRAVASITPRQADVLTALCLGLTNPAIARRLDISEDSVKRYTSRLYAALGARDRCHCVALAASEQITVHVKGQS